MVEEELEKIFLEAYEAYADAIFRHCLFRVREREKAKDITQETFTRTWEYMRSGKKIDYMRAFLYRVAKNLIIDNGRVSGRTTSLESCMEDGMQPEEDEGVPYEFSAEARMLAKYVDQLDPMYREVIIMRYMEDLSVHDIAHQIGETETNVSVRIHRAIEKLRTLGHVNLETN
ncbi:MAG: sigma-70 family RNA polymerase sigma factor [Candidatus Vogelbacteria bacterium]|nr:sigma-70 family RNA polymerase sigma factor [Candidatus Vogelbacteria bacterium]